MRKRANPKCTWYKSFPELNALSAAFSCHMNMSSLIYDLDQRYKPLHVRYPGIYTCELPQSPPPLRLPSPVQKSSSVTLYVEKIISTVIKLKPVLTTSPILDLTQSPRFSHLRASPFHTNLASSPVVSSFYDVAAGSREISAIKTKETTGNESVTAISSFMIYFVNFPSKGNYETINP